MRKFAVVILMPLALFGQELVGTFSLDTSIYTSCDFNQIGFIGPEIYNGESLYQRRGTNQCDIFTDFYQKIGTIILPTPPAGTEIESIYFSQKFLDEDIGWEFIVNYINTNNLNELFKVIDETGTVLLSDNERVRIECDGQNTYVFTNNRYSPENPYPTCKVWKFRSNISSASRPLSKSSTPGPMMAYMPSGDLRVSLQPVTGGTSLQIFDMLGRQIFSKNIQNIREPTSFIIPSSGMPNTPFVARVNNDNGSFVKKGIPVR